MKKLILFIVLLLISFVDNVKADEIGATISVTGDKYPGSDVTIIVTTNGLTETNPIVSYDINLTTHSLLDFKSCKDRNNQPLTSPSVSEIVSLNTDVPLLTCTFKISNEAASNTTMPISFNESILTNSDEIDIPLIGSQSIVVQKLLSSIATLNSITLDKGTLSPNFNKDVLSYNVIVDGGVETINISAVKTDTLSTVSGLGSKTLNYGNNKFNIIVTAENKTQKTYVVNINRTDNRSTDSSLKSLTITSGKIDPVFKSSVREYTMIVKSDVKDLEVKAIATSSKATVKVIGNNDLIEGMNIVTITVTAENGKKTDYIVTVMKEEKNDVKVTNEEKKETKEVVKDATSKDYSMLLYIVMASTLILLIALGIYILVAIDKKPNKM